MCVCICICMYNNEPNLYKLQIEFLSRRNLSKNYIQYHFDPLDFVYFLCYVSHLGVVCFFRGKTSAVYGPHLQTSTAKEVDQTSAVCNKKIV
ncbi:hypothetical protein Hanom_Chr12g01085601 [Helianthus anomalus]